MGRGAERGEGRGGVHRRVLTGCACVPVRGLFGEFTLGPGGGGKGRTG